MKKFAYSLMVAALALVACNKQNVEVDPIPDDQKDLISFSLSDETVGTKAGFTGSATSIAMRIQSDKKGSSPVQHRFTRTVATASVDATHTAASYSNVTFADAYKRYWDDAHGRSSLLSVFAVAVPNGDNSIKNNNKTLEQLLEKGDDSKDWGNTSVNDIEWTVTTYPNVQTKDAAVTPTGTIDKEDLVYSNNIKEGGVDGIYRWDYDAKKYTPENTGIEGAHYDGRMLFFQEGMENPDSDPITTAAGYFDKGHLKFNHALSRISIRLEAGDGFTKAASGVFDLSSDGIQLLGMKIKGKLNLPTGIWTPDSTTPTGTIVTKPTRKTTNDGATPTPAITSMYYETVAQMLPDYAFAEGNTTNVLQFTIDGNEYYVTQAMIYAALYEKAANRIAEYGYNTTDGNKFIMMQGKNYSFTITIDKTPIKALTATLKAWDNVDASFSQDNTHITVSTSSYGSSHELTHLYRLEQTLDKIYTDDSYSAVNFSGNYIVNGQASLVEMLNGDSSSYDPKRYKADGWYYKDNQTAYHLRSLNDRANGTASDADTNPSVFTMQNAAQGDANDYHWGAPMISTADLRYNTATGYTGSIHKGFVAPTNGVLNPINITELHMMSNINIILKTTPVGDGNHINLRTGDGSGTPYKYTTVKLTKLYSNGSVDMGTGLVTTTGDLTAEEQITCPDPYFVQTGSPAVDDITTTKPYTWTVVPQALKRSSTDMVGITITTPDSNEYYIIADLSLIKPTSVGSQVGQMHNTTSAIDHWYPNHSYTYTFTLTKKGIDSITCTLADWVTVDGGNTPIDLEK